MVNHQFKFGKVIQKLRYGSKMLSLLKGLPVSQVCHLAAGILGAGIGVAGLVVVLWDVNILHNIQVPWTSEQRASSEIFYTIAGLQNLGNNCFLNVIIQALASCGCFHSFLQSILDADDLETEERSEKLPLTVALVSLLEELCIVRKERTVLSPRRVMLAMGPHVSAFNLTRQQDAAEALLLLLSSLEEEVLQCYVPNCGSLVDVSAFPCRVTSPELFKEEQSECKRWQQQFSGEFHGTIGSILTCGSCSSQLSVDLEFFRCLPITPVWDRNTATNEGCTLEDCLKHFTTAENLENYRCDRCSHVIALKYLLLKPEENEAKIKILSQCVKFDSCDCKNLFSQDGVAWPTGISHARKQLIIARCPKILCIHLQRASMDISGELVKIQGHISFPLVLDLLPFTAAAKEIALGALEENTLKQAEQRQISAFYLNRFSMPQQLKMLPYMRGFMREDFSGEIHIGYELGSSSHISSEEICGTYSKNAPSGSKRSYSECHHSELAYGSKCQQSHEKAGVGRISDPLRSCRYRLSSVVEHYGSPRSGHYAAYRKLMLEPDEGDSVQQLQTHGCPWFYVSDHNVSTVSVETVLGAEASLLFYERID